MTNPCRRRIAEAETGGRRPYTPVLSRPRTATGARILRIVAADTIHRRPFEGFRHAAIGFAAVMFLVGTGHIDED